MIYDLQSIIRQQIAQSSGRISFADYMQQALYHPVGGYYSSTAFTLGKDGDFTTAPEISPLFAECIARLAMQVFEQVGQANILELGAGTGRLAKDVLLALKRSGIRAHYYIYEISPTLRVKQLALLKQYGVADSVTLLEKLPEDFTGLIVANEVLDALPFCRFQFKEQRIKECCVSWQDHGFGWELHNPLSAPFTELAENLVKTYELEEGYTTEIHTQVPAFVHDIANCLTQGLILLADYGYGQREYYHPQRKEGTLTCFYKHQKHADPFFNPGQQDITTHVDFTQVAENALLAHCELHGFTTLSSFLFHCGMMDIAAGMAKNLSAIEEFELHQAIKTLTMPTEMGEVIKIMGLCKNVHFKALGFGLLDRRRDL